MNNAQRPAALATGLQRTPAQFLTHFVLLSILNGVAVGMGKIITTLYALHHGATAAEIGLISSMESLGKVLVTIPAGFTIATHGAKAIYFFSSILPMLLTFALPLTSSWYGIGILRGMAAVCIPFRVVSMNSSFLQQLKFIGAHRAGWYRAARAIGVSVLGPGLAALFTDNVSYILSFMFVGAMFGAMAFYGSQLLPSAEPGDGRQSSDESILTQVRQLLRDKYVGDSCLIEFVNTSANALFTTFIILVTMNIAGLDKHDGVLLLFVDGVSSIAGLFLLGYFFQRIPNNFSYGLALSSSTIGLALLGSAQSFACLVVGTVLLDLGSCLIGLVNTLQLSNHHVSKSKIAGVYNLASMLGGLFGAVAGAVLSKFLALQSIFLLWIPLLAVVALVCLNRSYRDSRASAG